MSDTWKLNPELVERIFSGKNVDLEAYGLRVTFSPGFSEGRVRIGLAMVDAKGREITEFTPNMDFDPTDGSTITIMGINKALQFNLRQ